MKIHLSPASAIPIEGKFGQAKIAYGFNKIRARLSSTSASWIAAIALVLNLVKLARQAFAYPIFLLKEIFENIVHWFLKMQLFYKYEKDTALLSF